MEAVNCFNQQVAVVGGGNSAGQAAVFLSSQVEKVYLIIRGKELAITMSNYLEQRIKDSSVIELLNYTEVESIHGDEHLEGITVIHNQTKEKRKLNVNGVFSFIGATPRTDWLPGEIKKDEKGFIKTGIANENGSWHLERQPFLLETSRPGIFAVGDVRSNSVKRVASAVGEGSMSIQFIHEYLKELQL